MNETQITRKAIETVWRIESARLIGGLVRVVKDGGLAEDLAQEALLGALETWPKSGIPANAGAWLMTTSRQDQPRARPRSRDRVFRDRQHPTLPSVRLRRAR